MSIREIVTRLNESKVGAFFIVNGDILSDEVRVRDGESYGGFVNHSSHWDLWRAAQRAYPVLRGIDYDTFPRGRVIYDTQARRYIVYLDPKLNNEIDIDLITDRFGLRSGTYIIDDEDEHYQSSDNPPLDVYIDESISFDKVEKYIKRDIY